MSGSSDCSNSVRGFDSPCSSRHALGKAASVMPPRDPPYSTPILSAEHWQGPSEASKQQLQKGVLSCEDGTSVRLAPEDIAQVTMLHLGPWSHRPYRGSVPAQQHTGLHDAS